jgi:hypothetical protein
MVQSVSEMAIFALVWLLFIGFFVVVTLWGRWVSRMDQEP